jgi:hypothetical protein
MFSKKVMIATVTTAALVWPAAAPARLPDQVPSPPSWTAASAGDAYEQVRSAAATDGVQDLRSPDTRDQASGYAPVSPDSGGDVTSGNHVASGGFDAVSGALGAAAGISLAIAAVALAGGLAGVRRPRHHAARG